MSAIVELILRGILEFVLVGLCRALSVKDMFPGECWLMRHLNLFLLGVAVCFLTTATIGVLGWSPFWIACEVFLGGCAVRWLLRLLMTKALK